MKHQAFLDVNDKPMFMDFVFIYDNGSENFICSVMEGLTNSYNGRMEDMEDPGIWGDWWIRRPLQHW